MKRHITRELYMFVHEIQSETNILFISYNPKDDGLFLEKN